MRNATPIISRTTTLITAIIAIVFSLGIWSAFKSFWSVLILLAASIGGMIVFLGLWVEKEAGEQDKKEHLSNFTDEKRRIKLKAEIGWWILMGGVVAEIVISAALAGVDIVEHLHTENKIAANDPRNLPIEKISGYARIEVLPPFPNFAANQRLNMLREDFPMQISDDEELKKHEIIEFGIGNHPEEDFGSEINLVGWVGSKTEVLGERVTDPNKIRFDVFFDSASNGFPSWVALNPGGLTFNKLKFVGFSLRDVMPPPLEIVSGRIDISVNHVLNGVILEKTILILPQTNRLTLVGQAVEK